MENQALKIFQIWKIKASISKCEHLKLPVSLSSTKFTKVNGCLAPQKIGQFL